MVKLIATFVFVFVTLYTTTSTYKTTTYHMLSGLSGTATSVREEYALTHIHCACICMLTSMCGTMEYNSVTRECKMYYDFGVLPSTSFGTSMFGERCPRSLGFSWEKSLDLCYKVHDEWKNWYDAQTACVSERGELIKVDTLPKLNYLKSNVPDVTKHYWTGATDVVTEGQFYWRDGTSLALDNPVWGLNQPDDWTGEDCCEIKPELDWKIQDDDCVSTLWFICEYVV